MQKLWTVIKDQAVPWRPQQVQTCAPNMLLFVLEGMQEQDNACSLHAHGDHVCLQSLLEELLEKMELNMTLGSFEEDVQFICRVCIQIYDTAAGLYEHLKRFHKILVQDN